jgi:hypothetical protein
VIRKIYGSNKDEQLGDYVTASFMICTEERVLIGRIVMGWACA